jgi:hypothetical protein
MENSLLPNEIVLKILGYLGLGDLIPCAKVSKRFNALCRDKSLSYRSIVLVMKGLTVKHQKLINDILTARPNMKKVKICSISWEAGLQKRLSEISDWKSLGLYEKAETLQKLGASSFLSSGGKQNNMIGKQTLELDVFYFMSTSHSAINWPF